MSKIRFLGLDVHADTIAVAVAESDGEVRRFGVIPNQWEAVRRMVKKLGPNSELRACYEAGPTGYVLFWQLTGLGVACQVVAPSLVPTKAGDRVKTDRRDAEKLARCCRAGDLTAVWVPDAAHEALRDLVRAREDAKHDQLRARHRLSKFLLRHGRRPSVKMKSWTQMYMAWVKRNVHFEEPALEATLLDYVQEVEHAAERIQRLEKAIAEAIEKSAPELRAVVAALQALRGIAMLTAVTIIAELGILSRFLSPRQLMGYSGLVPSEFSSGNRVQRGKITKTGNAHSAARRRGGGLGLSASAVGRRLPGKKAKGARSGDHRDGLEGPASLARTIQETSKGKNKNQIVTAVGRELLGFIWAIAVRIEGKFAAGAAAA